MTETTVVHLDAGVAGEVWVVVESYRSVSDRLRAVQRDGGTWISFVVSDDESIDMNTRYIVSARPGQTD